MQDRDVFPAFLIGYEGPIDGSGTRPPWIQIVRHQYGGLSCMQWVGTGCLLRLAANQCEGTGKLWLLTRALVELGEMWPNDALRHAHEVSAIVDEIRSLYDDRGSALTADGIRALDELLVRHLAYPGLSPPRAESGNEALIRFRDADPLPFFDSWRVACSCRCAREDVIVMHESGAYDRPMQEAVQLVGRGARPRIFLLWENSD